MRDCIDVLSTASPYVSIPYSIIWVGEGKMVIELINNKKFKQTLNYHIGLWECFEFCSYPLGKKLKHAFSQHILSLKMVLELINNKKNQTNLNYYIGFWECFEFCSYSLGKNPNHAFSQHVLSLKKKKKE